MEIVEKTKSNSNLILAKQVKNDEFYTLYEDIENELKNFNKFFKGKIVLLNCDDSTSNFWKYFSSNFKELGLKKIVAIHYSLNKKSYKLEMDNSGTKKTLLKGDGDFRSKEVIEILKKSDIVCTNPPFSLFREYVNQLVSYNKKFIIIGSKNSISYKDVFKLIKENSLWLGVTSPKEFLQPDGSIKKFGNIGWFTNLDHKKRNEQIILDKVYSKDVYPIYDNFNAIEVSKVKDIPFDYKGIMGVPITFLDKYNPIQFEIIGIDRYTEGNLYPGKRMFINGSEIYARILIKKKK